MLAAYAVLSAARGALMVNPEHNVVKEFDQVCTEQGSLLCFAALNRYRIFGSIPELASLVPPLSMAMP